MSTPSPEESFPPEFRELALMSQSAMAKRFGISETTAARRRAALLEPYHEAGKQRPRLRHEAHKAVERARRSGELVPAEACQRCGARPNRWYREADTGEIIGAPSGPYSAGQVSSGWVLQAHHGDVYKPLDVEWLCPTCHGKADNPPRTAHAVDKRTVSTPYRDQPRQGILTAPRVGKLPRSRGRK